MSNPRPTVLGRRATDPDSRARTHLANERTFLAWLRTGLTLVAIGLASAQLLNARHVAGVSITALLAVALVLAGAVVALLGRNRYHRAAVEIEEQAFRPHRHELDAAALAFVVCVILAAILAARL